MGGCKSKQSYINLGFGLIFFLPMSGVSYAKVISKDEINPLKGSVENVDVMSNAVGNSVLSQKTNKNSTVQVFRYSAEDIKKTGQTNIFSALSQLSPAISASPVPGIGGNAFNRTMQLRNLSADQTLVLVNGKRRHVNANFNYYSSGVSYGTEPVDISLIPISAIESVEIITEGASALYGQDAEAGAINIILKKSSHGGTLNVQNSGYYAGDGQSVDGSGDVGFALGHNGGFLNFAAQVNNQLTANRSGPYLGKMYFDPTQDAAANRNVQQLSSLPRTFLGTASVNLEYPITENLKYYSLTTFAHKDVTAPLLYRSPSSSLVVRALHPNGLDPLNLAHENDFQVNNGFTLNKFLGMQWDFYGNYGRDQYLNYIKDSNNPSYGLQSQDYFYGGRFSADELTVGFKANKYLNIFPGHPKANLEWGFEYRRNTYHLGAGDEQSYANGGVPVLDGPDIGAITPSGVVDRFGVPPNAVQTIGRNIFDGHINLTMHPLHRLEVTFGGHVASYSDQKIVPTGSLGLRYNVNQRLAIRGNVNTGYRPPTLGAEGFFTETTYPGYVAAQLPANSVWAKSLGAGKIKGESTLSYSVGIDYNIIDNFKIQANLYQIHINDRLYNSSQFGGATVENILANNGLPNVLYASYFSNPVNTRTSGGDIAANYMVNSYTYGTFNINFSVNFSDTQITHYNSGSPLLQSLGLVYFNRTNAEYLTHSAPRNIESLSLSWKKGPWSFRVQEQRFGSYTWVASPSVSQANWTYVNPSFITNIDIGYQITPKWGLNIGAYNLGNEYPTRANATSRAALQNNFIYPGNSPYGSYGGMYYVSSQLSF